MVGNMPVDHRRWSVRAKPICILVYYIRCTGEETTRSLQPTWGLVRLTARVSRGKNTVFLLRYRFSLYT
ncbi:hypothetical protein L208DRAFT_1384578 [Tricholoma matsutake]|nr:hypothetical protein L208DRAFT_1384578 [Tricholoma matsutake 945]